MNIQIKNEYRKSYSPLTTVALFKDGITPLDGRKVDSIKKVISDGGKLPPIKVNDNGFVVDGMHRFAAYTELNLNVEYEVKNQSWAS